MSFLSKRCSFCKEFKNYDNFVFVVERNKHAASCKQCSLSIKKPRYENISKIYKCINCMSEFKKPSDKNHRGLFCSRKCVVNYKSVDDRERLLQFGLRDLNENYC